MVLGDIKTYRLLKPNNQLHELINYIDSHLYNFAHSTTYEKIIVPKKKNENQHSTAFSLFMMKHQDKFSFINEFSQKGSHKIDIAVIEKASDEIIFTIEAKVLPTPKNKTRTETEYVYNPSSKGGAGIERFKNEYHGLDSLDNLLPENGLVGYVKDEEFEDWFDKINQWILAAEWDDSELLKFVSMTNTARLISVHRRKSNTPVTLHHFWVKVK